MAIRFPNPEFETALVLKTAGEKMYFDIETVVGFVSHQMNRDDVKRLMIVIGHWLYDEDGNDATT